MNASSLKAAVATIALLAQAAAAQAPPPPPPPPAPPVVQRVVEFSNVLSGRHVWVVDPVEAGAIESGAAGPGWARNGYYFDISNQYDEQQVDVCRFYSPASNSHFFTANAAECQELRRDGRGWVYEKVAFRAFSGRESGCGGAQLYRLYNNQVGSGATHRFTTDRALRRRLIEQGWADEGVAFCVRENGREIERTWVATSRGEGPRADCEDPFANIGTCVMIRSLPAMRHAWPSAGFDLTTGFASLDGTLFTAQAVDNTTAVSASSYVRVSPRGGDAPEDYYKGKMFGFRLVGSNRIAGDLATMGLVHQFPVAAPASPSRSDERVFPWADGREHDLKLSFDLKAWVGGLYPDASQSYGVGVLRFQDRTTGRALMAALAAWGRTPPGNAVFRDIFTGQPIVATFFGQGSSFGAAEGAGYVHCDISSCLVAGLHLSFMRYGFRISRADFAKVIALARQVDPGLSIDPADYMVSSFQFRGETYLDAAVGFSVDRLTLSISK